MAQGRSCRLCQAHYFPPPRNFWPRGIYSRYYQSITIFFKFVACPIAPPLSGSYGFDNFCYTLMLVVTFHF
jgi:hypothetical protein